MASIVDGHKICNICKENKVVSEFYVNKSNANGIASWCRLCTREYEKVNRPKRVKPPDQRERLKYKHILDTYGLTREQYDQMFESQGRKCRICKRNKPGGKGHWHVDHDHKIGPKFVRGILCITCNNMLGSARDSAEVLRRGADYLDLQYIAY